LKRAIEGIRELGRTTLRTTCVGELGFAGVCMYLHGKSENTLKGNGESPRDLALCVIECKSNPV
jgi:hypothetical protein